MMSNSMPLTPTTMTRGFDLGGFCCRPKTGRASKKTESNKEILLGTIGHPGVRRGVYSRESGLSTVGAAALRSTSAEERSGSVGRTPHISTKIEVTPLMGGAKSFRMTELDERPILLQLFPSAWRQMGRRSGAVRRLRGFPWLDAWLRALLLHVGCGWSLRETAV